MTEQRVQLRADLEDVVPYRQGRIPDVDAFKLSSNENPYPPLPGVVEAIAGVAFNRYPEATSARLRAEIAARWGVEPDEVIVGPGSVTLLAYLIWATCTPAESVLYSWRSFEGYPQLAAAAGVGAVEVPNRPDGGHDLEAMARAITPETRLVILCSPNNPTGTVIRRTEFEAFMDAVPPDLLVVLDEAYAEFVTDPLAVRGPEVALTRANLVVLRTMSKAYGLAGLRVGYAVGPRRLVEAMRTVSLPLSVTEVAEAAALASLEREPELLERVATIVERRDRIRAALLAQGWAVPESNGNFVWLPTGGDTARVGAAFEEAGIIARPLGEGVRVSVGEEESVEPLLRVSGEVVGTLSRTPQTSG